MDFGDPYICFFFATSSTPKFRRVGVNLKVAFDLTRNRQVCSLTMTPILPFITGVVFEYYW